VEFEAVEEDWVIAPSSKSTKSSSPLSPRQLNAPIVWSIKPTVSLRRTMSQLIDDLSSLRHLFTDHTP
jgi:hypothetical protein